MLIVKGIKNENQVKKILDDLELEYLDTEAYKNTRSDAEIKEFIISTLERKKGMDRKEFFKKCRKKEYVYARHMARKLLKEHTTYILKDIAHATTYGYYGDHATVLHSLKESDNIYETDDTYRKTMNEMIDLILRFKGAASRITDPISLCLISLIKKIEETVIECPERVQILEIIEDLLLEIDEK